jgi:hypothetical protein
MVPAVLAESVVTDQLCRPLAIAERSAFPRAPLSFCESFLEFQFSRCFIKIDSSLRR